ncbi:MAG TPA: hypothetical protein VKQ29_12165 [Aliidongia sp.]|nr:hypothetical protein [Aliidongia sp.]
MAVRYRSLLLVSALALLSTAAGAADVKSYAGSYRGRIPLTAGSCDTPDRVFTLTVDNRGAAKMLFHRRAGNSLEGKVDSSGALKLNMYAKTINMELTGKIDGPHLVGTMTSDEGCTWAIDLTRG